MTTPASGGASSLHRSNGGRGGPRVFYAAGPGNVIGTYRHWRQGQDDPTQIAVTYSGQFYDAVRDVGATALVVASCHVPGRLSDGPFHIEHRAVPFDDFNGPLYHLGQVWYGLGLLVSAIRYRADVAVVCGGTHWFMLSLFAMVGIRTVASVHCTLWRDKKDRSHVRSDLVRGIVRRLDGWFFRRWCDAALSVSDEISRQIWQLSAGGSRLDLRTFVPIYRRSAFAGLPPLANGPAGRSPFRVLFVGRMERNKGIFDLKKIARRFEEEGPYDVEFDLCGTGSAMQELQERVRESGMAATFRIHGHCNRDRLREMYARCHVVIAPTSTDFLEGFNKVVVEGVLAGRPVITSSVCPSVALVRDAVLEVPPDDVRAYGDAIVRLRNDPALCEQMARGAMAACEQFYDETHSWGTLLRQALTNQAMAAAAAAAAATPVTANRPAADVPERQSSAMPARAVRREVRGGRISTAAAAAARFNSFGGMVVAAALGVLAALLGFVGISRDHPVPIDGGTRPAPRHLHWSDADRDNAIEKPIAQSPPSKTARADDAAQ